MQILRQKKAGMQQGDILTKVEGEDLAELGYAGHCLKFEAKQVPRCS